MPVDLGPTRPIFGVHLQLAHTVPVPPLIEIEARFLVGRRPDQQPLRDPALLGHNHWVVCPHHAMGNMVNQPCCLSCDVTASDGLKQGQMS